MERWRAVPGYPDYAVSNTGKVKRITAYQYYIRNRWYSIHRLVLLAFVGDPPTTKHVGAHQNGLRSDNRLENLRWATHAENFADRRMHGTYPYGEKNPNARLSDADVRIIRSRYYLDHDSLAFLGRLWNVSATTIGRIVYAEGRREAGGFIL